MPIQTEFINEPGLLHQRETKTGDPPRELIIEAEVEPGDSGYRIADARCETAELKAPERISVSNGGVSGPVNRISEQHPSGTWQLLWQFELSPWHSSSRSTSSPGATESLNTDAFRVQPLKLLPRAKLSQRRANGRERTPKVQGREPLLPDGALPPGCH